MHNLTLQILHFQTWYLAFYFLFDPYVCIILTGNITLNPADKFKDIWLPNRQLLLLNISINDALFQFLIFLLQNLILLLPFWYQMLLIL